MGVWNAAPAPTWAGQAVVDAETYSNFKQLQREGV